MFLHGFGPERGRFGTLNRLLRTDRLVPRLLVVWLVAGAWSLCSHAAQAAPADGVAPAALRVATVEVHASDHYDVDRIYGGELRARRGSTLGFRHAGELAAVHVDEGDRIDAGMLLAELDAAPFEAALDQARAQVARAEAGLAVARAAVELSEATDRRFADLVERDHASRQTYDEVRLDLATRRAQRDLADADLQRARADRLAAEVDLARTRVEAPFDGRVQGRFADEGTILVPGQQVLRVVESGILEARVGLPTDVAAELEPGARHRFRSGRQVLEGDLLHVLPEVDAETRTVTALFRLEATSLPGGSVVELLLRRAVPGTGFWVPSTALTEAQRGLWSVYVVGTEHGASVAERRIVEVIHTTPERVYVQGTLRDGERVIATGTQRLVPGQPVAAVAADPARFAVR